MAILATQNVDTKVRISWLTPASNGSPIDAYQVLILQADGATFAEDPTDCDGSSLGTVTNLYCDVPSSSLLAAPYNLTQGMLVAAIVRAHNANGWGSYSQVNIAGATIQVAPLAVSTLTYDPASSSVA
jgi:hypothetical protein